MAVVSDVEIRLRADIARLRQDLQNARGEVNGALGAMSNAVEKFKGVLGGIAFGAAVGGIASLVKSSIDAVDALNDMSVRTKVAIEDLAGLAYGAKLSDTSLEGVASSITKLAQNVGKDGAKFRELGVTATEPLEAFKQLADIFKDIKDPQQRAAFGAEVLGKSWQEAAVLLDNGAEGIGTLIDQGKALSGVTEQVAADAGKFNDKLDEMGFIAKGVGTRIAADLLPMLNQLVQDFSATGEEVDGAVNKFNPLTEIFRTVIILGGNVGFVLKGIANEIGTWATQIGNYYSAIGQFIDLDFSGGWQTLKATFGKGGIGDQAAASARDARAAFDTWEESWVNVGSAADREAKRAEAAGNEMADSLIKNFTGAGKAAGDSSAKVAAFLNSAEIKAARDKSAAQAEAAAKKEQAAYAGLIASIKEKEAASKAEIEGGAALTPVQQMRIKLDEELKAGKITLTAEHIKEYRAMLDSAEAMEKNAAAAKQTRTAVAALADEQDKSYEALVAEAAANENLAATYGKTKLQIAQMTLARDEDRLSQSQFLDMSESTVAALQREIEARKRNIAAMGSLDVLDAQKKASEDAASAQKDFWKSIDDTAHATFVSIANGSKDTAQRLKDTFKNVFFDWLYQQTIKKWFINVGMVGTTSAAGAAESIAGGGSGGSAMGLINAGKSIYQGFSSGFMSLAGSLGSGISSMGAAFGSEAIAAFGAGLQGGALGSATASAASGYAGTTAAGYGAAAAPYAGLAAGAGIGFFGGNAISGQYGSKATTAIGTAIGAVIAGPLGAAVGGLIGGIANRAFGMGDKKVTGQSIEGMLSATGATGNNLSSWTQKGGWFRSDKSGTTPTALSGEQSALFTTAYKGILDLSKTFGDALGVETAALSTRMQKLSIDFKGLTTEAEKGAAVTKFFEGVANTVAAELVPSIAKFAAEGEAASATLVRLATDYRNVDDILRAIDTSIKSVGVAGIEAREGLIAAAGGLDQLAAGVGYFQQNFYSEADKLTKAQAQVAAALSDMGLSSITTSEQFKAAALGIDLGTKAGADLFVQMLALAPTFKEVADAAEAAAKVQADAAIETAKAAATATAERLKANEDMLRANVSGALDAAKSAIEARKNEIKATFDDVMSGIADSITAVTARITDLRGLSSALAGARVGQQSAASRGVAQTELENALKNASASGVLPSADSLRDSLAAVSSLSQDQFGSMIEYQREQARAANSIAGLSGLTDEQLTTAEKTLLTLQGQKASAEAAYARQIGALDAMAAAADRAAQIALGTYQATLSADAGIATLAAAVAALKFGATTSNPGGAGLTVGGLYESVLGRTGDAAGMAFWQNAFGSVVDSSEYAQFIAGAAAEMQAKANGNWSQWLNANGAGGTMPTSNSAMQTALDTLNSQMAGMQTAMARTAMSTTKLADQFDQVSGGGNALFTESA